MYMYICVCAYVRACVVSCSGVQDLSSSSWILQGSGHSRLDNRCNRPIGSAECAVLSFICTTHCALCARG